MDLKVKQANDKYLFNVNQELEEIMENLKDAFAKHWGIEIEKWCLKYIFTIQKLQCLYFPFGKYKGRIVQDIVSKDKDYCEWFLKRVYGKNEQTLKILDYLNKAITFGNYDYMFIDLNTCLMNLETTFVKLDEKSQRDWKHNKDMIKMDYNYKKGIRSSSSSYNDFEGGSDIADDWMCEVYNYEDFC